MKAEEAAKWMDMLCERSLKMDESGKFDQVAALIRAQAEVVEGRHMSDIPESAPISLPTIEPKTVDPKGQTLSNEQRQIISRCITKSNAAIDAERLRARIAELEARLSLAEKVVEAAEQWSCIEYGDLGEVEASMEILEALAAWREGK